MESDQKQEELAPEKSRPAGGWMVGVVMAGCLLSLTAAAWWQTESMRLEYIEISGTEEACPEAIEQRLSGFMGKPLWSLDLLAVQQEVTREPLVQSVEVRRVWPDGMRIVLEERREFLLLAWEDKLYRVCREGTVMGVADGDYAASETLPVLTGVEIEGELRPGEALDLSLLEQLLQRRKEFDPGFWANLAEVHMEGDEVTFFDRDGVEIRFGELEQIAAKVQLVQAAHAEAGDPPARINVRGGESAHVTFRDQGPEGSGSGENE